MYDWWLYNFCYNICCYKLIRYAETAQSNTSSLQLAFELRLVGIQVTFI